MAKPIMIQGTMSNAGKSLVTAGLCRIFRQDGLRVAPFKSQNMALNSFITSEGLEMGRAQVMQAEAAGVEPSVRMNPILLKPTSDSGSQVIVNGEVLGNYSAKEYFAMKGTLVPHILSAYGQLSGEHDVIVIEGAGSPAEINLKAEDIVNMGMARMARSPVLLVGDIDRGGVFASIYGTIALLEPDERAMVKGILINKFRGDVEILRPGLKMLEDLTGIPVVGVIPYLHVDIDDEDSLSQRLDDPNKAPGLVEIAIIRLPRISNFTDFNRLEQVPGITVRYVSNVRELGSPDLMILPGTKNTMGDLLWLRQTGLEAAILKRHSAGCPVIGICGGYQMLGQQLHDPEGFEAGGELRGLGLLPVTTIFEEQKVRTRVRGVVQGAQGILEELAGASFYGYEIHMGRTVSHGSTAPLALLTDETDGSQKTDGLCMGSVYGTYVHGFFDSEEVVRAVAGALFRAKGLTFTGELSPDYEQYKNQQYDKLAEQMRASVDMQAIYRILEEGL